MDDKEWDELKLIQEKLHEALDKGYPPLGKGGINNPQGAKKIVEDLTGIPRTTLQRKIDKIEKLALESSHWTIEWHRYKEVKPQVIIEEYKKPIVRIPAQQTTFSKPTKVFVIPDAHCSPEEDNSRFLWIGKAIKEYNPDYLVCIGDFSSFDSCSFYDKNHTVKGQKKPPILQDINTTEECLKLIHEGMGDINPVKHYCLGNHEMRLYRYENEHKEVVGAFSQQYETLWRKRGWGISEYGDFYFIKGVAFVHVPMNEMGREIGGKMAEASVISNGATHDIVFGHSHRERSWRASKLGKGNYVKIVNVGTCMNYGHLEEYAKNNANGWSYGITQLMISDGHIQSHNFISMLELQEKYDEGQNDKKNNATNEQEG
tara:strand:- start:257 stop:1375 length:1119 start_codon:yes stop_codon:yes gene_type:complete